ncbi:hypothetical protein HanPSC8_Chr02g0076871 [Helianthus annuus]|nr:hypothetical protein HanPSC8_Chr02g0076871 [Helianthus annuus]
MTRSPLARRLVDTKRRDFVIEKSIKSQVVNNVLSRLSRIIRFEPSSAQMFNTYGRHV